MEEVFSGFLEWWIIVIIFFTSTISGSGEILTFILLVYGTCLNGSSYAQVTWCVLILCYALVVLPRCWAWIWFFLMRFWFHLTLMGHYVSWVLMPWNVDERFSVCLKNAMVRILLVMEDAKSSGAVHYFHHLPIADWQVKDLPSLDHIELISAVFYSLILLYAC